MDEGQLTKFTIRSLSPTIEPTTGAMQQAVPPKVNSQHLAAKSKKKFTLTNDLAELSKKRAVPQKIKNFAQSLVSQQISPRPPSLADGETTLTVTPKGQDESENFSQMQQMSTLCSFDKRNTPSINRSLDFSSGEDRSKGGALMRSYQSPLEGLLTKETTFKQLQSILKRTNQTQHNSPQRASLNQHLAKRMFSPRIQKEEQSEARLFSPVRSREEQKRLKEDLLDKQLSFKLPSLGGIPSKGQPSITSMVLASLQPNRTKQTGSELLTRNMPGLSLPQQQKKLKSHQDDRQLLISQKPKISATPDIQFESPHLKFNLEGFDDAHRKVESKKSLARAYKEALRVSQRLAVNANKFKNQPFLLLFSIKEREEGDESSTRVSPRKKKEFIRVQNGDDRSNSCMGSKARAEEEEPTKITSSGFYPNPQPKAATIGQLNLLEPSYEASQEDSTESQSYSKQGGTTRTTRERYRVIGEVDDKVRKKVMSTCYKRVRQMMIGPNTSQQGIPPQLKKRELIPVFNICASSFFISNIRLNRILNDIADTKGNRRWADSYISGVAKKLGDTSQSFYHS